MPLAFARLRGFPVTSPDWARLHEPSGDFRRVGLPSRASLRTPSRNRLTDRDSSHGLCLPTAHAESKVPNAKGLPADRGYVRRVWLPSRRFAPFDASPVLFHTGSAHGIHPSELSPLERHRAVSRREEPTYRSDRGPRVPEGILGGPAIRGFWALLLPRVPGDQARV